MSGVVSQPAPAPSQSPPPGLAPLPRIRRGWRLLFFYSCALVLTGLVSMLFADLLWRTGWSMSRTVLMVLFVILFFLAAVGCMHGIYGFVLRKFGDERRITRLADYHNQSIATRARPSSSRFIMKMSSAFMKACAPLMNRLRKQASSNVSTFLF